MQDWDLTLLLFISLEVVPLNKECLVLIDVFLVGKGSFDFSIFPFTVSWASQHVISIPCPSRMANVTRLYPPFFQAYF